VSETPWAVLWRSGRHWRRGMAETPELARGRRECPLQKWGAGVPPMQSIAVT
jgi:hypothetical protein